VAALLTELTAELARHLTSAAVSGEFPASAATLTAHGTWRRAQADAAPGTYTTSLPFQLAKLTGSAPERAAADLAARLADLPWVSSARVYGGYLAITVTPSHLASLPARIVAAGQAAAYSDALAGRRYPAPPLPDLEAAPSLAQAWRSLRRHVVCA
jgi:arginyl-tRNA synthetase